MFSRENSKTKGKKANFMSARMVNIQNLLLRNVAVKDSAQKSNMLILFVDM